MIGILIDLDWSWLIMKTLKVGGVLLRSLYNWFCWKFLECHSESAWLVFDCFVWAGMQKRLALDWTYLNYPKTVDPFLFDEFCKENTVHATPLWSCYLKICPLFPYFSSKMPNAMLHFSYLPLRFLTRPLQDAMAAGSPPVPGSG